MIPILFKKPVFTSLSPNVEKDDLFLVLKIIFQPWKWRRGESGRLLEKNLKNYLGEKDGKVFVFSSGRAAFLAILQALNLPTETEVILPGFTCNAAVNPILEQGLKPIFCDIDNSLKINSVLLPAKITPKTGIVLAQHTFGQAVRLNEIEAICKNNNLILIEDCAHCLGAKYKGKLLGTFGKASFFSFGRDKVISAVFGGAVFTKDIALASKISEIQTKAPMPSFFWIFQQLLHPILTKLWAMPFYRIFGWGRLVLIFLQKTKIISKAVSAREKRGERGAIKIFQMPNALSLMALQQLQKIERFNSHRNKVAGIYQDEIAGGADETDNISGVKNERIFLRFPIVFSDAEKRERFIQEARHKGFFLDDGWADAVIMPKDTLQDKMGYNKSDCPVAESIAKKIVNLPTHINIGAKQAKQLASIVSCVKNP